MGKKKRFIVNHWDTFDNEDFTVGEADTREEADAIVEKEYAGRLHQDGADVVQIYDREKRGFIWRSNTK